MEQKVNIKLAQERIRNKKVCDTVKLCLSQCKMPVHVLENIEITNSYECSCSAQHRLAHQTQFSEIINKHLALCSFCLCKYNSRPTVQSTNLLDTEREQEGFHFSVQSTKKKCGQKSYAYNWERKSVDVILSIE